MVIVWNSGAAAQLNEGMGVWNWSALSPDVLPPGAVLGAYGFLEVRTFAAGFSDVAPYDTGFGEVTTYQPGFSDVDSFPG